MGIGSYVTQVPTAIPGCVAWLDAADTSTITSSAGSVSSVRNKADVQIPFIQASGGSQPTTGANTIGGNNVITFNGSSQYLTANGLATLFSGADVPCSFFVVFSPSASVSTATSWAMGRESSSNALFINDNGTANGLRVFRRDSTIVSVSATTTIVANGATAISSGIFTGTSLNAFLNGTSYYNTTFDVGSLTLDRFTVGARNSGGNVVSYLNGSIAELILYKRSIETSEHTSIIRYLSNKWGVSAA